MNQQITFTDKCNGVPVTTTLNIRTCSSRQVVTVINPVPICDTSYHPEIVALKTVDGTPSLEQLETTTRSTSCTLITIVISVSGSPERQAWRLDDGLADGGDAGQLSPDDYDPVTNDKHWLKVG